MEKHHASDLTDRQKECLRLVARGFQDKEIAREVGISHETVRKHLKSAMARLGVGSRFVAARLLVDLEAAAPSRVPPERGIPVEAGSVAVAAAPIGEKAQADRPIGIRDRQHDVLQEERIPYSRMSIPAAERVSEHDRHRSVTSPLGRLVMVGLLTILIALAVIAAIPMSNAVQQMVNAIDPP